MQARSLIYLQYVQIDISLFKKEIKNVIYCCTFGIKSFMKKVHYSQSTNVYARKIPIKSIINQNLKC